MARLNQFILAPTILVLLRILLLKSANLTQRLGLDQGFCNHPCVVVDMLDGYNADEERVSVCIVSAMKDVQNPMKHNSDLKLR